MVTAAELLGTATDMIFIDVVSRTINIPKNLTLLGVTSDEDVQKLRFTMSRHYNGIDLSTHAIRINYENAQGEGDVYSAVEKKVTDDTIEFTWIVSRHAVAYKGNVKFTVCAILTDADSNRISEFNTIPTTLPVIQGLETDQADVMEEYPDAIAAAAVEALAKAKENGDFTPKKGTDYYTPEEAEAFGQMVVDNAQGQFANAIKGIKSGEVVRVDDVSPIEHVVKCWPRGKNVFNGELKSGIIRSEAADMNDGENGVYKSIIMFMPKGTYTVSFSTAVNIVRSLIDDTYRVVNDQLGVTQYTFISATDGTVGLTFRDATSSDTVWDSSVTIQIERGSIPTAYEPYIDTADITLTAFGKNLIDHTKMPSSIYLNGVTISRTDDAIKLNGTLTVDSVLFNTLFDFAAKPDEWYTLSYEFLGGAINGESSICVGCRTSPESSRQSWLNTRMTSTGGSHSLPLTMSYIKDMWFYAKAGVQFTDYRIRIQLEKGKEKSTYEKSKIATYSITEDSETDVVSISPTMTLVSNIPGVTTEAEYSRDTTKMFESYVLSDRAIGAIAAEIEDDMVEVLEDLNDYAESFGSGEGPGSGGESCKLKTYVHTFDGTEQYVPTFSIPNLDQNKQYVLCSLMVRVGGYSAYPTNGFYTFDHIHGTSGELSIENIENDMSGLGQTDGTVVITYMEVDS